MGVTANGYGFPLWGDEGVLKLDSTDVMQLCKYTKNTELYTLKG